jgi:hypothetical protein
MDEQRIHPYKFFRNLEVSRPTYIAQVFSRGGAVVAKAELTPLQDGEVSDQDREFIRICLVLAAKRMADAIDIQEERNYTAFEFGSD